MTNQPEPSLRDDDKRFVFNLDINASDEFKAGFNEATEQVDRAISLGNILFQADKEAAVREAEHRGQIIAIETLQNFKSAARKVQGMLGGSPMIHADEIMARNLQNVINGLRGNDLPYGDEIVEALQLIENELDKLRPNSGENES